MKKYAEIVKIFRAVKNRPSIYIGNVEPRFLECFLNGFYACYGIYGGDRETYAELRKQTLESRGWKSSLLSAEMERRGLSAEQCVEEVLDIEIETWLRLETLPLG